MCCSDHISLVRGSNRRCTYSARQATWRAVGYAVCTNDVSSLEFPEEKPYDWRSLEQPFVMLPTTAAKVSFVHAGCAQRPVSQELTGLMTEVFEPDTTMPTRDCAFRHFVSGDVTSCAKVA